MHTLTLPPGGREHAHLHRNHETAIYIVSGTAAMYFGDDLSQHIAIDTGQFLYIPPNVPHLPYNPSETEPCVVVLARTDPNEQESVVLLPDIERQLHL